MIEQFFLLEFPKSVVGRHPILGESLYWLLSQIFITFVRICVVAVAAEAVRGHLVHLEDGLHAVRRHVKHAALVLGPH